MTSGQSCHMDYWRFYNTSCCLCVFSRVHSHNLLLSKPQWYSSIQSSCFFFPPVAVSTFSVFTLCFWRIIVMCISHSVVKVSFLFTAIYCPVAKLYPRFVPCPFFWHWTLVPVAWINTGVLVADNSGKLTEIARLNSVFCLSCVQMVLWIGLGVGNMGTKMYTFFMQIANPLCHK